MRDPLDPVYSLTFARRYSQYVIRVNQLSTLAAVSEEHAMMHAAQRVDFLGDGVTDLDFAK
jgi:hypothetical protein